MKTAAYILSLCGTAIGNTTVNDTASVAALAIATACLVAGAAPPGSLARAMTPLVALWRRKP